MHDSVGRHRYKVAHMTNDDLDAVEVITSCPIL